MSQGKSMSLLCSAFRYLGYRFIDLSKSFDTVHYFPPESHARWLEEDPTESRWLEHPLNSDSLVVDLGGFDGDWAMPIYCRYSCNIDIYEPNPKPAAICEKNFAGNQKIRIFREALSDAEGDVEFYGDGHNASFFETGKIVQIVQQKIASRVFNSRYPSGIDLLKINVEGAEYRILPNLLAEYDITKVKRVLIMFHLLTGIHNNRERADELRKILSTTHKKVWGWDYIFECWELP